MEYQAFKRFEYKYVTLYSLMSASIGALNSMGNEGWELIELYTPKSANEQYKALLKRELDCVKV